MGLTLRPPHRMDPANDPHSAPRKAVLEPSQTMDVPPDTPRKPLVTGAPHYARPNAKRPETSSKLISGIIVVALVQLGLVATAGWVFYKKAIQPGLTSSQAPAKAEPAAPDPALQQALARLTEASSQIDTLQSQLDGTRAEQARTLQQLQETNERVVALMRESATAPVRVKTSVSDPGEGRMASVTPNISEAGEELVLIKERNRLTAYADKAIATGEREPLQALVETMLDPDMARLHYAAQAEFNRVRYHLEYDARIDPNYTLPVRDLFKNPDIRSEADLKPAQLFEILENAKQPWEARLRAAWLLKGSEDPETDAKLFKAIREDTSLDVLKQAQTTLERRIGRRFRLFDIPSIEAWWETQHPEDKPKEEEKTPEKPAEESKAKAEKKPEPKADAKPAKEEPAKK